MKRTTKLVHEKADDLESEYQFYRKLVKNVMFKLNSVQEQRIVSTWVVKCDQEDDESLKCGYIKLLLISLQHPGGNIKYFKRTAPKQLPFLESTSKELADLIDRSLTEDSDSDSDSDGPNRDRTVSAAVSSDMTSLATMSVDHNCVRVFYARSDHPIDKWHLPDHMQVPVDSLSPSRWEIALSSWSTAILDRKKKTINRDTESSLNRIPYFYKPDDMYAPHNWNKIKPKFMTPAQRRCRDLMSEQTVKESKNEFRWYEHSRLDGTLRPSDDICNDMDTCHLEKIQLELDERAKNLANGLYPGGVRIVIDPRLISEVTGTNLDPTNNNQHRPATHKTLSMVDPNDWTDRRKITEVYPENIGPTDGGCRSRSTKDSVKMSRHTSTIVARNRQGAGKDHASDVDPDIGKPYERFASLLSNINDIRSDDGLKLPRRAGRDNDRLRRFGETAGQWNNRPNLRSPPFRHDTITPCCRPTTKWQPTDERYYRMRLVAGSDNTGANRKSCCKRPPRRVSDSGRSDKVGKVRRTQTSRQSSIFAADGNPLPTLSEVYRRNQQRFLGARCIGSETPDPDHRPDLQPPRPDRTVRSFRYSEPAKPAPPRVRNSSPRKPNYYPDRKTPPQTFDDPRSRRCTYGTSGSYVPSRSRYDTSAYDVPSVPSRLCKNRTANGALEHLRDLETRDAQLGQRNDGVPEKNADRRRQGVSFTMTGTIQFDDETTDEQRTPPPERVRDGRKSYGTLEDFLENGLDSDVAAPREFAVPGCKFVWIDEEAQVPTPKTWQLMMNDRSSIGSRPSSSFTDDVNPKLVDDDSDGGRWPANEDSPSRNSTRLLTSPDKSLGRKLCQPRPASVTSDYDPWSRPSTW